MHSPMDDELGLLFISEASALSLELQTLATHCSIRWQQQALVSDFKTSPDDFKIETAILVIPFYSGIEGSCKSLQAIKQGSPFAKQPILLVSEGPLAASDEDELFKLGVDDIWVGPFRAAALTKKIQLLKQCLPRSTLRSGGFLDSLIENLPDMIFVKSADTLNFVLFNKAGEELLGYRRSELVGKNDYDFS